MHGEDRFNIKTQLIIGALKLAEFPDHIFIDYDGTVGHIVAVVSPLASLMENQVNKLRKLGISAVFLSDIRDEDIKEVDEGCSCYGSPEA